MNKVIIMGRLTRDPEARFSAGDNPIEIVRFTLAVDRKYKKDGEPTADFINCIAFGKTAEVIEKYVHQGNKIAIEGRWQTGSYTNKDGVKIYTNDCMVESIDFCESKGSQQNTNSQPQNNENEFMRIPDNMENDGVPFN